MLAHFGFWAAAAVIVVMTVNVYRSTVTTLDSAGRVADSEQALRAIRGIDESLGRAASASQGYLLSANRPYLAERDRAAADLRERLSRLETLVADDPAQVARVSQLGPLVAESLDHMQQAERMFRTDSRESGRLYAASGAGTRVNNRIYALTAALEDEELRLMEIRRADERHRYANTLQALLSSGIAVVLVLILAYAALLLEARAREKAKRQLLDIAENIPGAVFQYRRLPGGAERYEYLSSAVERALGAGQQAALKDPQALWHAVVEEDRPALAAAIRQAHHTFAPFQHEFRTRLPDNAIRWLRMSAALRRERDGSVLWNGYWADVTAQKNAEAERDRFFTLSLDMLCIAHRDGYFKRVSPAFTETLGWTAEELLSRPFIELVHPDDVAATLREMENLASGRHALEFENRYRYKDGGWRVLSWKAVEQDDGVIYASARDVTDQRNTQAELIKARVEADAANRAKSTFLATMSHEIRTPMHGILGMLELMSLTRLDEDQRSTLEIVRESGRNLQRIIDDVLDFSKIEAGKLDLQLAPGSLAREIGHVRDTYSGAARRKGLMLGIQVDSRISPALLMDSGRLRQVLSNLVSNAIKFTPSGSVEIAAELSGRSAGKDQVRITVADTGVGIPAEGRVSLFEPFVQLDRKESREAGGTGLGLSICRRLVAMMDGSIDLESEVGKGTRVTATLSLQVCDAVQPQTAFVPVVAAHGAAPTVDQAEAQGTLVLLAEDHETSRMLLMRQLNTLGYAAVAAENGTQALEIWQSDRFAMLITDCNMPGMDGFELARRIRALESETGCRRMPIIACTANALSGDVERCFAAGMDDYLDKPLELADLSRGLNRWLPLATGAARAPGRAAAPAAGGSEPVDRSVLARMTGGDPVVERELLANFRSVNDSDLAALRLAVNGRDHERVTGVSHRIAGASGMLGARGMADISRSIEQSSRAGEWDAVVAGMDELLREWARLKAFLDAPAQAPRGSRKHAKRARSGA